MRRFIAIWAIFLCVFLSSLVSLSQIEMQDELTQLLEGKKKFQEIIKTVHVFYNEKRSKLQAKDKREHEYINRQLKFWTRWELFNRERLNENQEVVNVEQHNWNIYKQIQQNEEINSPNSSYAFWTPIGPTSYTRLGGHSGGLGRVNCIAFHPTNPSILYIGCPAGGLWRSANEGASWVPLTDHIPSTGISGIVVSHNNPNTIYILTGDGDGRNRKSIGVLKSTDGGQNWFETGIFPGIVGDYWGYKLIQDQFNANILFAATTQGIYKTINGGIDWVRKQTGFFSDIEFKPGNHNVMYAASTGASPFFRSENNGDNWTNAGMVGIPANPSRLAIGVTNASPEYVYLFAGPVTATGYFKGVFRSVNSGNFFVLTAFTPNILGRDVDGNDNADQSGYDLAITVNPSDHTNVIAGGINVWSSSFSGSNFILSAHWVESDVPPNQYVHADIHDLAYNPINNKLFVCSDGGVAVSTDNGLNWDQIWSSLQIMQFYHLTGYEFDYTKLIGGTQDNGSNYRKSSSLNYFHVLGADGYSSIIDFTQPETIFCTGNENVHRSFDGGISNDSITPTPPTEKSWPMIAMDPINHNTIFVGKSTSIYKSVDQGSNWTDIGAGGNIALTICPSNSSVLYASKSDTAGDVSYRLVQSGNNYFTTTLNSKPGFPIAHKLTDIAVYPFNHSMVWITVGGYSAGNKVFYSSNAGESWTNISGSLPNVATTAVAIDNNGNAYVGTDEGVFYRAFPMNDWVPFYNGLPKTPVNDLVINANAEVIIAATFGRGAFQSTLYSTCFPTLSLAGSATGNRFYEASEWISSIHDIYGGTGTEIFYRAGDSIILRNGFEVKEGSFFKGYLSPCASGIPAQSKIYAEYNVIVSDEIIKQQLEKINNPIHIENNNAEVNSLTASEREIIVAIDYPQFVQVYLEDSNHEILLWLIRKTLKPGKYRLVINDSKLRTGKVRLKINLDGEERNIILK